MTTVLSADGQVEIPEAFRQADALQPGQLCEIERVGQGEYRLTVSPAAGADDGDWLEWLLSCPEKDWLAEPDRSERTSLTPPRLFAE